MVDSKYYTPTIDEFYVGFEYETRDSVNSDWYIQIEDGSCIEFIGKYYINENKIRVKCLDKEDIESLGFKQITFNFPIGFENEQYWINFRVINDLPNLCIYDKFDKSRLFSGNIKNKSELVKLLKQLGING